MDAILHSLADPRLISALGGFAAGIVLGLVHFGSLAWNTRLYAGGGMVSGLIVQLLRLAVLAVVLVLLARQGAGALLCGALGLLVARHLVVRRAGGTP